jgi:glycosyltransferase involved in cell wall biosynthesis
MQNVKSEKKIAFYCDVPIYSGHDMMSAHIANTASTHFSVSFYYIHPKFNESLKRTVDKIPLVLKNNKDGLLNLFLRSWRDILHIAKLLKNARPDMVVVCQGEYHLCLKGLIASHLAGVPRILSYIPIGYPYSIYKMSLPSVRSMIYRFLEKRYHGFITITIEQMNLLKNYIGTNIPLYLLENFTEFSGTIVNRKKRKPIKLGIIGRIQNSKGQHRTIEIAERVLKERDDFQFLFFGEGENEDYLKEVIREKKLEPYFNFMGWVNDKKLIYSEINALLLLSDIEGLPLVLLESLYFKVPVFASRLKNNPVYERYIGENYIFDSSEELAEIIIHFENFESAFEKRADYYKQFVIDRHGNEAFPRNVLKLFTRLTGGPGGEFRS